MSRTDTATAAREAAKAAASFLGVPVADLDAHVNAHVDQALANAEHPPLHVYDTPGDYTLNRWLLMPAAYRRADVLDRIASTAGVLAADATLGEVFFPMCSDDDADEMAVPFAETLVRAAWLYVGNHTTRDGRARMRQFRLLVGAAVLYGFDDDEEVTPAEEAALVAEAARMEADDAAAAAGKAEAAANMAAAVAADAAETAAATGRVSDRDTAETYAAMADRAAATAKAAAIAWADAEDQATAARDRAARIAAAEDLAAEVAEADAEAAA